MASWRFLLDEGALGEPEPYRHLLGSLGVLDPGRRHPDNLDKLLEVQLSCLSRVRRQVDSACLPVQEWVESVEEAAEQIFKRNKAPKKVSVLAPPAGARRKSLAGRRASRWVCCQLIHGWPCSRLFWEQGE